MVILKALWYINGAITIVNDFKIAQIPKILKIPLLKG